MRPTRRRPVLLAAVLAVLFGILGMHALNSHGAMGSPASAGAGHQMSSMSAMADTVGDMVIATAGEQAAQLGAPLAAVISDPSDGDHGPAGMLMLCLAMLVAVAIALGVVGRSGGPFRWLPSFHTSKAVRWPNAVVRDSGPPSVWKFSVIRC